MIALSESFRDMTSGSQVIAALEAQFQSLGATHFVATGIPLPGRPIEPLVIRVNWADSKGPVTLRSDDAALHRTMSSKRPAVWLESASGSGESALFAALGGMQTRIIAVPVCAFLPYQAALLIGGANLAIDTRALLALDYLVTEAFRRLFALGFVRVERPGDLSARERRVVELSAFGKTANEIADILEISQRTVHAHLQNASEKLAAHNKTHTVVEALRYGQITV
jgi:DNA-binding CsgD family transcriptional regulator